MKHQQDITDLPKGQSTIEFTFAMVAVTLLIFGSIKVFQWVGMDYAQTSYAQQHSKIFAWETPNIKDDNRTHRLNAFTRRF
ncbi:MAG: hypothetical protein WCH62_06035 [Candidatus Omnitrophota bacterium]